MSARVGIPAAIVASTVLFVGVNLAPASGPANPGAASSKAGKGPAKKKKKKKKKKPLKVDVIVDLFAAKGPDGAFTARWTWSSRVPECISPARIAAGDGRRHGSWNYNTMGLYGFVLPGSVEPTDGKHFPSLVSTGVYEVNLPPSTPIMARFAENDQRVDKPVPVSEATSVVLYFTLVPESFAWTKIKGKRTRVLCKTSRRRPGTGSVLPL